MAWRSFSETSNLLGFFPHSHLYVLQSRSERESIQWAAVLCVKNALLMPELRGERSDYFKEVNSNSNNHWIPPMKAGLKAKGDLTQQGITIEVTSECISSHYAHSFFKIFCPGKVNTFFCHSPWSPWQTTVMSPSTWPSPGWSHVSLLWLSLQTLKSRYVHHQ